MKTSLHGGVFIRYLIIIIAIFHLKFMLKSLILLNYLLKNGSERVIASAKEHLFELRTLENYKCVDERGKDEGINGTFSSL
jgi:hypothetical protein